MVSALKDMPVERMLAALSDPDSIAARAWKAAGMGKVAEAVPHIGELADAGPVLVGCWHREVMVAYSEELTKKGLKVVQVHGGTPETKREEIRKRFNSGEIDVLLGQMRAMGAAWNIQEACSTVVVVEEHPSPALVEQFYKRVYRRGQTRACQLDHITSNTPIDKGLKAVRLRKAASDEVINEVSPTLGSK